MADYNKKLEQEVQSFKSLVSFRAIICCLYSMTNFGFLLGHEGTKINEEEESAVPEIEADGVACVRFLEGIDLYDLG